MKIKVGVASDIGRARQRNEDAYVASHPLYAVADGMGGHRGGQEASRMAVKILTDNAKGGHDRIAGAVRRANEAVYERSSEDEALSGMGTTITALLANGDEIHLAHVGDSRAYLLRDGEMQMLTEDHTLVQRMVIEGRLTAEQAQDHPQRSILTRALGVEQDVKVDEAMVLMREGDRLLLCTDGLTGMIEDEDVKDILEADADPQRVADRLVEAANRAGGLDNITVLVLDFVADGAEQTTQAPEAAPPVPAPPAEPAPPKRRARPERPSLARRLVRRTVMALIALALLGTAAGFAVRLYVDRHWYVGAQDGRVTIFRGMPTTFLGFDLSSSVRQTTVPVNKAVRLQPYRNIRDGITVGSRAEATLLIDRIRHDLAVQAREQKKRTGKP
jgi:protein phosphatase